MTLFDSCDPQVTNQDIRRMYFNGKRFLFAFMLCFSLMTLNPNLPKGASAFSSRCISKIAYSELQKIKI